MDSLSSSCKQLAAIMGGKAQEENGVCMVTRERKNLKATIGGRPFHALDFMFNFEVPDQAGTALITGEYVLTEDEAPAVLKALVDAGIIVSAVHNHWFYDTPKLIYLHSEVIMKPEHFAKVVTDILNASDL